MNIDFLTLIPFSIITAITPGPNNISSAGMGLNYGYKATLRYLLGIITGVCTILFLSAMLSSTLIGIIPKLETVLAIIGSIYITYLAYRTLRASYKFEGDKIAPLGFSKGLFLQVLNPKTIIYAITIYSTFLIDVKIGSIMLPLSLLYFSLVTFICISIWTMFGTLIKKYMANEKIRMAINIILSLLLLLTAVKMSGLLNLLK